MTGMTLFLQLKVSAEHSRISSVMNDYLIRLVIICWFVISEANCIFGFDGWQSETIKLKCVCERERNIGPGGRTGWGVTYTANPRR